MKSAARLDVVLRPGSQAGKLELPNADRRNRGASSLYPCRQRVLLAGGASERRDDEAVHTDEVTSQRDGRHHRDGATEAYRGWRSSLGKRPLCESLRRRCSERSATAKVGQALLTREYQRVNSKFVIWGVDFDFAS